MYGDAAEGPTPRYCAAHRRAGHVDLKVRARRWCGERAALVRGTCGRD
jgi:hypothetical protein